MYKAKIIGNNNGNFPYHKGLNTLAENNETFIKSEHCIGGGLYYCDIADVCDYLDYGHKLCIVYPALNAKILQIGKKYKTDKLVIKDILDLSETNTIDILKRHGADVSKIVLWAIVHNYYEVVKYLTEQLNVRVIAENCDKLYLYVKYGELKTENYLRSKEKGSMKYPSYCHYIVCASINDDLSMVKCLYENKLYVPQFLREALEYARKDSEVYNYLLEKINSHPKSD